MTRRTLWITVGGLVAAALVALYIASPWIAAARLTAALKSGDPAAIERMVDFPSVRASLSTQITARLNAEIRDEPQAAKSPFAGLMSLLAPGIVNQIVNMAVTPEGLARLSREYQKVEAAEDRPGKGKPKRDRADREPKPKLAYTGLNTFTATYEAKGKGSMVWVLGRDKVFFWKLKALQVSELALGDLTEEAEQGRRR